MRMKNTNEGGWKSKVLVFKVLYMNCTGFSIVLFFNDTIHFSVITQKEFMNQFFEAFKKNSKFLKNYEIINQYFFSSRISKIYFAWKKKTKKKHILLMRALNSKIRKFHETSSSFHLLIYKKKPCWLPKSKTLAEILLINTYAMKTSIIYVVTRSREHYGYKVIQTPRLVFHRRGRVVRDPSTLHRSVDKITDLADKNNFRWITRHR